MQMGFPALDLIATTFLLQTGEASLGERPPQAAQPTRNVAEIFRPSNGGTIGHSSRRRATFPACDKGNRVGVNSACK